MYIRKTIEEDSQQKEKRGRLLMYNLYYRWAASEEGRDLNSITRSWSTNCTIVERRLHCIRGQYKYLQLLHYKSL